MKLATGFFGILFLLNGFIIVGQYPFFHSSFEFYWVVVIVSEIVLLLLSLSPSFFKIVWKVVNRYDPLPEFTYRESLWIIFKLNLGSQFFGTIISLSTVGFIRPLSFATWLIGFIMWFIAARMAPIEPEELDFYDK